MFRYKTVKGQLLEERRKNEALNAQIIEVTDALVELAELTAAQDDALVELTAAQDDALVELAEITAENGTESEV